MRQNQSFSLLLLVVMLFSILPTHGIGAGIPTTAPSRPSQISEATNDSLLSPPSSTADQDTAISSVTSPAPPDTLELTGSQRSTELRWNLTQSFYNHNQSADVQVDASGGFLTHEH